MLQLFARPAARLAAALAVAGTRRVRTKARAPPSLAPSRAPPAAAGPSSSSSPSSSSAAGARTVERSARYIGVLREGPGATLWEAVLELPDDSSAASSAASASAAAAEAPGAPAAAPAVREISGGEYETEAEAARAYDALARMYLGAGARTNFARDAFAAWVPPERAAGGGSADGADSSLEAAVAATGQIATRVGVPLTAEEVARALEQERGLDVRVVPLAGRSDLAEALVFVTGRSVPHMRRMADMVARALRKRRLPGITDPGVEA